MDNPYEAPTARVDDPVLPDGDAERERLVHLGREAGLRGVGVLCTAFALMFLMMGGAFVLSDLDTPGTRLGIWIGAFFCLVGAAGAVAAWGYLALRPWVRKVSVPVALAALLLSSFMTLPLVGYAPWITWSAKGRRVLGADYAQVRAQAPHLRAWKRPLEAVILLGIFAAYVVAVVVAFRDFSMADG